MIGAAEIRNAKILVVDDSAVNVTLLTRLLDGAGYTAVTSTTHSTEVCALYEEHRHDLIILDLMMPELDGFEVLEGLRKVELEGYVPVIVLTAQPKHQLRALQAGARDFITKPFDQVEALARIHNMLEARLLLKESRGYGRLLENYDQLTGLPNRRRFRELLIQTLERPEAPNEFIAVLFASVDRFHVVNDVLGRAIGGAMLTQIGERFSAGLGAACTLARLEGAEFAVIHVREAGDPAAIDSVAQHLRDAIRAPILVEGHELAATLSIGISVAPLDARTTESLLACALGALNEARASGGDTVRYFSSEANRRAESALALESALRGALDRGEFVLHYQPKMHIGTGEWTSAEALLRWERPGFAPVETTTFIKALEDTGLIIPVGRWALQAACKQIADWEREGLGRIRVAVNVSSRQFAHKGFVADVVEAIRVNGISPDLLDIEITESALMSRSIETESAIVELKALGVRIALDDFGTGYSSLSYLRRYPIDTLKIDISFIRGVTTSPDDAAITAAIIQLARVLKMTVVAEGVETEEQLAFLRAQSCDEIQGYLFSHPLPAAGIASLRLARKAA